MPDHEPTSFTVHVDPDALARAELTAAVPVAPAPTASAGIFRAAGPDARPAGGRRAGATRAGRPAGAGRSRSYAFRRS
jgi:hypothetical protein